MNLFLEMENPIQPYAWGSRTAIARLLGQPVPADQPQAELWMGAHPKAPSRVWYPDHRQRPDGLMRLDQLLRQDPDALLGKAVSERFGERLPFLFKVLAVEQPLSIQAHPDRTTAEKGFARENALGIALNAPERNYRDDNHKPELVCALTPFEALCGFRAPDAIRSLLAPLWPARWHADLQPLTEAAAAVALRTFYTRLMTMETDKRRELLGHIRPIAEAMAQEHAVYACMTRLFRVYPEDVGVLSPALLHLIGLAPGEALFLPAGCLHAYLNGTGMELMANSDNVLRGGLTPKHVDVPELLQVLRFEPQATEILLPDAITPWENRYPSAAAEFVLSELRLQYGRQATFDQRAALPEILFCIDGQAIVEGTGSGGPTCTLSKGRSIFIPAGHRGYRLGGSAKIYKATVNEALL
ncbi:mannose-6-phosphate isomerase, class I [Desulfatitalea alkaliphila]|uniref:Mannose-6-phosphate isomerase n=1 Tax=Desulfatitalea alkaliphila TaxID=2929485 RepID=A0AA41R6V5_9BACT|nr:mannose-6-phosphate isomerase, class I [Desulfatitalea alkaliphila]MCJ8502016.1 mannose-6-phosphate isomerase, class I [Desulfatitalea alkaliphila]